MGRARLRFRGAPGDADVHGARGDAAGAAGEPRQKDERLLARTESPKANLATFWFFRVGPFLLVAPQG